MNDICSYFSETHGRHKNMISEETNVRVPVETVQSVTEEQLWKNNFEGYEVRLFAKPISIAAISSTQVLVLYDNGVIKRIAMTGSETECPACR